MDEQADEGARRSRRAALRALPTPADVELTVEDSAPLLEVIDDLPEPRIAELDALLREVDGLRSTLRRDLTLAATAAEAGEEEFAGWLLLGDDGHVRTFEERALEHLQQLEADEAAETAALVPSPRRRRRMLPAAPMVAACAALFGFLTGSVPGLPGSGAPTSPATSNVAALDSYAQLTSLATSGASEDSISAAAEKFHASLAPLVAQARTNPAAAEKAIALLNSERVVIAAGPDSPALRAVLRQADLLVAKLQARLPKRPHVGVVVPQQQPAKKSTTATKSSPAPSPKPSPTTAPRPSPKPSPTTAPKATPSPSPSNPLPAAPFQ